MSRKDKAWIAAEIAAAILAAILKHRNKKN